ncbi:hypothetical protein P4479_08380 [Brevibacillus agri]|nr:hypothetical protein [Brevibacillus agri]MDR9507172.1 hypothetical protein [Brevibacillus agri]MED3498476.1 hypothetical protein [Brevibacillus agri]
MRRAIARFIYPQEFILNDKLFTTIDNQKRENSVLKLEVNILLSLIEKVNQLTKNGYEVLGIEKTEKGGEWVIIFSNWDYIYVGEWHGYYNDHVLSLAYTLKPDKKRLVIDDIQTTEFNKGYGSVAMKYLIEFAQKQKVEIISGWISPVDWDHINRLKKFYENHDFIVSLNHEAKRGSIKRVLVVN